MLKHAFACAVLIGTASPAVARDEESPPTHESAGALSVSRPGATRVAMFRAAIPARYTIAATVPATRQRFSIVRQLPVEQLPAEAVPALARDERQSYGTADRDPRRRHGFDTKLVFSVNSQGTQSLALGGATGKLINAVPWD